MHEMWHFWKDEIREACVYADDETVRHPREDSADLFAWYVTSPARIFLEPRRTLDLRTAAQILPNPSPLRVTGNGSFTTDVVGESFYQDALEAIVGHRSEHGWNLTTEAVLVCENTNPYDPKAVRVDVSGRRVGYLSRERARLHRRRFGTRVIHCAARIVGGWKGERGSGDFGVRLDL
jgi:hypothetical protein